VTWIDGTGYVVSPLDGVNGVRNLLASIGLAVGCRVSGAGGRSGSAAPSLSTHNSPLAISVKLGRYSSRALQVLINPPIRPAGASLG
jgi:hypothetical protein